VGMVKVWRGFVSDTSIGVGANRPGANMPGVSRGAELYKGWHKGRQHVLCFWL
jgi:hypothetical protein